MRNRVRFLNKRADTKDTGFGTSGKVQENTCRYFSPQCIQGAYNN